MRVSDLAYDLPSELIAQRPTENRGESRLMLVDRESEQLSHHFFGDLPDLVASDDLFVLNNTRVFPARLFARRSGLNRSIEVLLLGRIEDDLWEVLVRPGRRVPPGTQLLFDASGFSAQVLPGADSSRRRLRFEYKGDFWQWINLLGETPLPPYIKGSRGELEDLDRERYQTVYAKQSGSVAAPTAGLHFTREILRRINSSEITLHVGYGTFRPVSTENIEDHRMESEWYSIGKETVVEIARRVRSGARVVAVGTTTTRALEYVYSSNGGIVESSGETDLFIYPGFRFKAIQGLLTNFHLPGSTLLALVSAFAGTGLTKWAYQEAVDNRYRFYSYGDAMLIL